MIVTSQLIGRLEASAAGAATRLALAIDACSPGSGAESEAFGRGALVASGAGRYVNRAVGITLEELADDDLAAVEAWYGERQLPAMIELSAWAPPPTVAALSARGYSAVWFRAMLVRPLDDVRPSSDSVVVVEVGTDDDAARWQAALSAGFELSEPVDVAVSDEHARADRRTEGGRQFLALVDGEVAGCGAVTLVDGVAWLGGAATLPEHRGRGVQAALVHHRLDYARRSGAELAAATAIPSGASARNLARLGFSLVQHQVVVQPVAREPRSVPG